MTNSGTTDGLVSQSVAASFGPPAKRRSFVCAVDVQPEAAPNVVRVASLDVAPVVMQAASSIDGDDESEYVGVSFSTLNPTVSSDLYQYEPWTLNFDPDGDEPIEELESEDVGAEVPSVHSDSMDREPQILSTSWTVVESPAPSQLNQQFRSVFPSAGEKSTQKNFYETFAGPAKPYIRRKKALDYYSRRNGSDINVGLTGSLFKANRNDGARGSL